MKHQVTVDQVLNERKNNNHKIIMAVVVIILAFVLALMYLDVNVGELVMSVPEFFSFLFEKFFPPNFTNIHLIIPDLLQTISFAFMGSILAIIVSLILALLMSEKVFDIKPISLIVRAVASLFRNIPTVIWGSLFVYIFGIGSTVAIITLFVSLSGFLTKAFSDAIDEIPNQSLEGIKATGASRAQVVWHGILPQFKPAFINWSLYAFEIGVRASSILGIVGAGGIGVLIQTRISLFRYPEAMAIVLVVVALVLIVELITNTLRKRLI